MQKEMKVVILLTICGMTLGQNGKQEGSANSQYNYRRNTGTGMSVKLAKLIDTFDSAEQFLNLVEGVPENAKTPLIGSRIAEEERSNAIIATPAKCMPELQPVSFSHANTDPAIVYHPSCTRIKRCGGCCSHPLLSCQPTGSVTKNFQVLVTKLNNAGSLTYSEKQIIPLEEHTSCACDCTIKPKDCTGKQVYLPDECICACSNIDEEEKCNRNNDTKLWDPTLCACLCRDDLECNTGFYYDPVSCNCEQIPISSLFENLGAAGYNSRETPKARDTIPLIVPLDANNRRRKNKDDPEYK